MTIKVKRKNGVFQGFDFGSKEERAKRMAEPMGRPGPLHGLQIKATSKPRKNGVYQGTSLSISNTNSRRGAAKRTTTTTSPRSTVGDRYAKSLEKGAQTPSALKKRAFQKAANRKAGVTSTDIAAARKRGYSLYELKLAKKRGFSSEDVRKAQAKRSKTTGQ